MVLSMVRVGLPPSSTRHELGFHVSNLVVGSPSNWTSTRGETAPSSWMPRVKTRCSSTCHRRPRAECPAHKARKERSSTKLLPIPTHVHFKFDSHCLGISILCGALSS